VRAQEGPVLLEPVTVTATSNPLEAFEYPGQVSVIGREQMQSTGAATVDDVLRYTPGVESVGGPRRTGEVPSIRGFDGPDVTVLFDGVRQNFNSGHDGRLFIDPDLLERVEVVRGPTSALYGSGGLGGTIEFRTVEAADFLLPGETIGARTRLGYRTANNEDQYALTGFGRAGGFDLLGGVSYRDAGSIELGDGSRLRDTDEEITSGLAKVGYDGFPDHQLELSWLGYRGDVEEPANGQGMGSGGLVDKDIENDTLRGGWRWNDPTRAWLDLNVVASYARNSVDEKVLDDAGVDPPGTKLGREVDTYGLRVDNRSRLRHFDGASSLLTYGVEGFLDEQDGSSSASAEREREGVPDADATTLAAFVQNELTLTRPLGIPGEVLTPRTGWSRSTAPTPGRRRPTRCPTSATCAASRPSRFSRCGPTS
jgi:hemoglobin/transferrin/lactoferrin receptor protein